MPNKAKVTGQACAFVRYQSPADADACLRAMSSGYEIRPGEGNLTVKFADSKPGAPASSPAPCYGGGGYGGKGGYSGYDANSYHSSKGGDKGGDKGGYGSYNSGKGGGKGDAAPSTKLYVGSLPADIQKETLEIVFQNYGSLQDIHIMKGRSNFNDQSCAFVRYASVDEAQSCVQAMAAGYEIRPGEGPIVVKFAADRGGKDEGKGYNRPY